MSEVNLNFTVNNFSSTMLVDNNEIVVNPVTTDLTVFAGFAAFPPQGGAGNGQVIFNNAGLFDSSSYFTFNKQTGLMSVPELYVESINAFGNVMLGNVTGTGNISIAGNISGGRIDVTNGANLGQITNLTLLGGSEGQYLRTDGNGTVTFQTLAALGPNGALQFNNANVIDGIPNVTFSGGNLNLGNSDSVKITGGENSYVLQTDGTGNLTWIPQAGNIQPGNGIPGGANSQVQFNNAGKFGGDPGFTYNRFTDTLTVGNLTIAGSIGSTSGELVIGNLTANLITGNGFGITNIQNSVNADYAILAGNLTLAGQSNITTIGTLSDLNVIGTTKIQQAKEKVTIVTTAPNGNLNYDVLSQSIVYYTSNIAGNIILNVRGNSTTAFNSVVSTGESMTLVLMSTVGSTVYFPTQISVDGTNITPKWISNVSPSLSTVFSNTLVGYSYTFIKTGSETFTVLASFTGFK